MHEWPITDCSDVLGEELGLIETSFVEISFVKGDTGKKTVCMKLEWNDFVEHDVAEVKLNVFNKSIFECMEDCTDAAFLKCSDGVKIVDRSFWLAWCACFAKRSLFFADETLRMIVGD